MPLYKQIEFAEIVGKTRGYINTYIKRRKIVMSGDYIDTDHAQNREMMEKWLAQKNGTPPPPKPEKPKPEPKKRGRPRKPKEDPPPKKTKELKIAKPVESKPKVPNTGNAPYDPDAGLSSLDRQKAIADIELKEARIRILALDEAKLRGENIPTSMVGDLISLLSRSFQTSYKNGAQQILLDIAHELKMDPKQEAKFKGKLIRLINKSHDDGIKEAKMGVKNIVEQISVIDGSGE